ncbi:hypothetical protein LTR70_005144 [Exophiala xenobiotica]|uniref:Uncharacterized protein n=1 Tax=Lithohypha guttulata TaxID=1690604 RepID=A0ABR0KCA9_9EURO|nr:hypothetical protein LTR24_004869 [Lithohypha guttulata]KAK5319242.1 hypothetical protein LTR70_005144 [Exophiala xenobiotica]
MLAPCLRRLEPDNPERVFSNAQTSTHRYGTSKRSDVRENFPFPGPARDISRNYAHGPQPYLDDNLRAEKERPRKHGKHGNEALKGYSVTDDLDTIATLDKHNQEWYWKGCTAHLPPNAHHVNKPHEGSQTPFQASYGGSGGLASRHSNAQEEPLYPTSGQVIQDTKSNDYITGSPRADHAVPGSQCWSWNRDSLGDSGLANGRLDAFDLELLESIQPEGQYQASDLPPPRHSRVLEIGPQNLLGEDGQTRSSRPRLPADSVPSLHMQALTSGSEQSVDHQLRLNRPTLQRSLKEEAFNPYTKSHLFA